MKVFKVVRLAFIFVLSFVMWDFLWIWIFNNDYDFFGLSWLLICSYFLLVLQIIIHEAGHGLFGRLTGYKMISFRVLSFMWSWHPDGKIVYQQTPTVGLSGQCLMAPPEYREDKWPIRWYLSGGVIANLVVSTIVLIFLEPTWYLNIFSFFGFVFAVFNGIPDGHNDGKSILLASQRKEYRYLLYLELKINQLSNRGLVLSEMPKKYFEKISTDSKRTHLDDYHDLLRANLFLDTKQWKNLQEELEALWEQLPNIEPVYQPAIKAEMLFYLLVFQSNDPRIDEIWEDKKFRKIMKHEDSITQRLKAAYLYYREKNLPAALDILDSADEYIDQLPTMGRKKREMQLIHWFQGVMIEQGNLSDELEPIQPVQSVSSLRDLNADEERSFVIKCIIGLAIAVFVAWWM